MTVKHPYYLVAIVDWEDKPRILATGTLQDVINEALSHWPFAEDK